MTNNTRKTIEQTLPAEHIAMTAAKRLAKVKADLRMRALAARVREMRAAEAPK